MNSSQTDRDRLLAVMATLALLVFAVGIAAWWSLDLFDSLPPEEVDLQSEFLSQLVGLVLMIFIGVQRVIESVQPAFDSLSEAAEVAWKSLWLM